MINSNPKLAMMAQVAISCGDAINAYRLINEKLSVPEAVEVLAQSPKYREILPSALEAYTQSGARIGNAIASFPEFDHRRTVARELSDLLETNRFDAMGATTNLEDPHVQEQLYAVERGFPKKHTFDNRVNPVVKLAVMNAMYGQSQTIDRLLGESLGSLDMVPTLQLAVDGFKPDVYAQIVNEIFGLYADLHEKGNVRILHPGIKINDIDLTKVLRSFANKYQQTKREGDWAWSMPMLDQSPEKYSWDGNTFADTVKRAEGLFETGRASFVEKVLSRINGEELRGRIGRKQVYESPKEVLDSAERLKAAKLPEEIYAAFGTEFDGLTFVGFAQGVLQEPVLARIRALDKMGPHLGKAAIAYTACHESPENVLYVAEHILDVAQLGKTRNIYKAVMAGGRQGQGTDRLRAFLPEGIDLRKLTDTGKKIVRATGFRGDLEHMATFHDVLRENKDRLRKINELPQTYFPTTWSDMGPKEVREIYEEFLGIRKVESQ